MDLSLLQHSAFLNALGSAIINSMWQSCALWIAYHLIFSFYGKNKASVKNICATFFVLLSAIFFFISFIFTLLQKKNPDISATTYYATANLPRIQSFFSLERMMGYANGILPYLSVAYIFLFLFFMMRLANAYKYIYTISNSFLLKEVPELHLFATRVAAQINISKKISVWISEYVDVPATVKFFKPLILIPIASVNSLSTHQLEAIILHELFHIKRHDYLINLIISVIETILFFNPFVMLLIKNLKRERENCCDDFVLQYRYDPHAYATALLHLEKARVHSMKLAMGAVSGKQQLLMRIKRITNNSGAIRQFNYGQKLVALIVATGIVCSFAYLSPKHVQPVFFEKKNKISSVQSITQNNTKNKKETKKVSERASKKILIESDIIHQDLVNNSEEKSLDNHNKMDDLEDEHSDVLNYKKITLPKSIDLSGIPFLPRGFKIDLGNIDQNNLNKDLRQAYKEINAFDWKKIRKQINENLQQANLQLLSSRLKSAIDFKKAQDLLQINAQQQFNFDSFLSVRDLLQRKMDIAVLNNNKIKLQNPKIKRLEKLQQTTLNNESTNYLKSLLPPAIQIARKKNITISIKHTSKPSITLITDNNKLLQFSFKDKSDKGGQNLINIEFDK